MPKPKDNPDSEPKRRNRVSGVGEILVGALDPALRKRGFASRDIITHWKSIAPAPYGEVAMPDKLAWPRGERSAQGATLHLRCLPGHQLALQHEAPRIAAAINRYFGYVLVDQVRLSANPFSPGSGRKAEPRPEPDPVQQAEVGRAVSGIADDGLRAALTELGLAIATQRR
jgi:hypothetical protein